MIQSQTCPGLKEKNKYLTPKTAVKDDELLHKESREKVYGLARLLVENGQQLTIEDTGCLTTKNLQYFVENNTPITVNLYDKNLRTLENLEELVKTIKNTGGNLVYSIAPYKLVKLDKTFENRYSFISDLIEDLVINMARPSYWRLAYKSRKQVKAYGGAIEDKVEKILDNIILAKGKEIAGLWLLLVPPAWFLASFITAPNNGTISQRVNLVLKEGGKIIRGDQPLYYLDKTSNERLKEKYYQKIIEKTKKRAELLDKLEKNRYFKNHLIEMAGISVLMQNYLPWFHSLGAGAWVAAKIWDFQSTKKEIEKTFPIPTLVTSLFKSTVLLEAAGLYYASQALCQDNEDYNKLIFASMLWGLGKFLDTIVNPFLASLPKRYTTKIKNPLASISNIQP